MPTDFHQAATNSKNARKILQILSSADAEEDRTPGHIREETGMDKSNISSYLKGLNERGFIDFEKSGRKRYYSVEIQEITQYWWSSLESIGHAKVIEHRTEAEDLLATYIELALPTELGDTLDEMLFSELHHFLSKIRRLDRVSVAEPDKDTIELELEDEEGEVHEGSVSVQIGWTLKHLKEAARRLSGRAKSPVEKRIFEEITDD